ncbi:MAG: pyruvate:ferredoxin (flavodoxin) oxidoreductase [bacterium]|nr:pyruvate:ferredoxin (flavodoxin) oxidoreductase [bacterium]
MSEVKRKIVTLDGNEAVAHVAYRVNEVIAIYPITPSSTMGELADSWSAENVKNIWGSVPQVIEMQSEGGAAGAVHGALQAGALTTTFTASQGLLLMIPNMYKIAGELTSAVIHVAARALAAQALSIFGDHSDVMAARATGFAMLCSNNVQEAMDMALVAHAATLDARIPFIHFFDGFRTSHEVSKVELLSDDDIRTLIDDNLVRQHRERGLNPDRPVIRGTAQNPDVYFQGRESVNPYYLACPTIVQNCMDKLASLVGRQYQIYEYSGHPEAERVIITMGSSADTVIETVNRLNGSGEKVGVLKVRLYRPFSAEHFLAALPKSTRAIAVLDRTKEPGCVAEPLYLDVISSFNEKAARDRFPSQPLIVGGRYGLSSKEFTPAMVKAVYDNLAQDVPRNHFTVGINDDVTHTSLPVSGNFHTSDKDVVEALFYGLGSDGTVGANKNSIKIIGEETDNYAQGYFVYDSKKTGSLTISHLRFGPKPINSPYLITEASFIACHQFQFLDAIDVLRYAAEGATFLLNSPFPADIIWSHLPKSMQETIISRKIRFFVVDGYEVARIAGMGRRVNTILQACFFAISGVLPREDAIAKIKYAINKTYGKRGEAVVQKNYAAVDAALDYMFEVKVPGVADSTKDLLQAYPDNAPEFYQRFTSRIISQHGDDLPVSAMPVDGTYPVATSQYEKRNIAIEVPVWDSEVCIQCGKCVLVCPHAVIRGKVYDGDVLSAAPETFKSTDARWREMKDKRFTLQVAVEDCTGCALCVDVCPAKNKSNASLKAINMQEQLPIRESERENWDFFLNIPEKERYDLNLNAVKDLQLIRPLFEFSGACAGCGETPYLKLMSQLFGDRAIIANATGCSSIYGGNLPTTPWAVNADGRGPAWANSLFEDNAEFGLGMRLAVDKQEEYARELLQALSGHVGEALVSEILAAPQATDKEIDEQRVRIVALKGKLASCSDKRAKDLLTIADMLVAKSVWIIGGDGWAYDIGYGGLDHVLACGRNVNILVMDTEVYSNTGGQKSKSTPKAAVAKFAVGGKSLPKKDLSLLAMTYGHVYVGHVAMGSNEAHTIKVFREAEAHQGPSLIIAYSHCIAHGYDMVHGMTQQKLAVQSGYWPLFRYNPSLALDGKNPFILDSKAPSTSLKSFAHNEARFTMLAQSQPERSAELLVEAQNEINSRWKYYEGLANINYSEEKGDA